MSPADVAQQSLKGGDPVAALAQLQEQVRAKPSDPKLRVFLFQLLCVLGQWDRALNQLDVAMNLDPATLAMARTYEDAIKCEAIRDGVFAGTRSPMIFGQPDQWLALLIESLLLTGRGEPGQSQELRSRAFDEAPASQGLLDGRPFSWIADADSRLGPVIEAIVNGRYYWIPFARLLKVEIDPPEDLRDCVWMPAHLQFENGGESVALIPTRYPGSATADDRLIALARKTVWTEVGPDTHHGLGQRVLATDAEESPLMDIRKIEITGTTDTASDSADDRG